MIKLKTLSLAGSADLTFQIFASPEEALAHLCDHVLTRPESHYWSVLIHRYRSIVDPTSDPELDRIADLFWEDAKQSEAQEIYDGYAREIGLAIISSSSQRWYWTIKEGQKVKRHCVGVNGVLAICSEGVVVSAMLERYAAPDVGWDVSYHDRLTTSRPRKGTWASSDKDPGDLHLQPAKTEDTRYLLFKKYFSSVSRRFFRASRTVKANNSLSRTQAPPIPNRGEWRRIAEETAVAFEIQEASK